ncbi:MAG: DUF6350 family protein [Actinobacteria bacterium]|nr:DUF6350 family protein [Actinomycetota bacterium]
MFQRVLWVSLMQVLRSIALVLLPTSFIALLGWATAGSNNGNTADPIRAALWIWMAAHHLPFQLILPPAGQNGLLTYLPIGALLLPVLAIRSSFARAINHIDIGERALSLSRILFSALYATCATIIAWVSTTHAVRPLLYCVPFFTAPGVWLITGSVRARNRRRINDPLNPAKKLLAMVLGVSSLTLGVSLFLHLGTVENLITVLKPGFLGGLLLLLLNIFYLPNAIIAALSYLAGSGFAVGAHTLISPWTHSIAEIPALPLLGALPTGRHPLMLISIALFVFCGGSLYTWSINQDRRVLVQNYLFIIVASGLLALLGSGALMTPALHAVGVSAWQMTSAIALEIGVGIALAAFVPRLADLLPFRGRR